MPVVGDRLVLYLFPYLANNLLTVAAVAKETAAVNRTFVGVHHAVNMNRSGFWAEEIAEVDGLLDAIVGDGLQNVRCGDSRAVARLVHAK